MPGRYQHKFFASPIGIATPNTFYIKQGVKPACQEDIAAKFSFLLLAQLPRTQFTHSKAPNPHNRKPSTQNFRISYYWHGCPEHNLRRLWVLRLPRKQEPRASGDQTFRNSFWRLWVLRLPHRQEPGASGDQTFPDPFRRLWVLRLRRPGVRDPFRRLWERRLPRKQERPDFLRPFLKALSTALATQTGAAGQRRPDVPQPFLKALHIAPATQTGAAGQRRLDVPRPFVESSENCACHANRSDQTFCDPFWRLWVQRLPRKQGPRASGDQTFRNPFWRLCILRLPRKQEPWASGG